MKKDKKQAPKKIQRKRLTDEIIDHLVSMIRTGLLKAGDRLPPEPVLMEQFGVGRSSLREAIGALSLTGLLSVSPGRGTFVAATPEEFLARPRQWGLSTAWKGKIQEIIEARIVLEQTIVGFAAERATEEDIAAIGAQLDRLQKNTLRGKKIIQSDYGFHKAMAKASHNSILERFFDEIQQQVKSWMEQKSFVPGAYDRVFDEHAAVLAAIKRRDVEQAKAAMQAHLKHAGDHLLASLDEQQPALASEKKTAAPRCSKK
ncbi:MAG TPA: FadR/GntR family transcriptional regulator [Dissulfurispiraceae bacterium]|nr:FadR/GntR family transcriptional regulator [Dissulfurispiraceae bacterium]